MMEITRKDYITMMHPSVYNVVDIGSDVHIFMLLSFLKEKRTVPSCYKRLPGTFANLQGFLQ